MSSFKGHKTGFNTSGSNECNPNPSGPPTTKFTGRGAVPEGPLQRYPGAMADISNGNRRLAKSNHGEGVSMGTTFMGTPSGFSGNRNTVKSGGSSMGDGKGRNAMKSNKK